MKKIVCLMLMLFASVSVANAQDDYRRWYQNVANGIDSVTAQALVSFTPPGGTWQSHYMGSDLTWRLDPNTTGTTHINYASGVLESGSVVFNKPVHLKMSRAGQCLAIAVKGVKYTK